jgi:putative transposase
MARPLRFQYPGAVYHVMARGDGGKRIFESDEDHAVFIARLGEACASHGWRVHAWVLMGNHFHLLLETPQPNLVAGMKWLLGTFSQGWNRARRRRGHVFQGRYKSVPVNSSDAEPYYFRSVADYIHLNPARAGLAGGRKGELAGY